MKKTLALLIAATGLTTVLALPAWSTTQESPDNPAQSAAVTSGVPQDSSVLIYVSDNDDDENEGDSPRSNHDDDDEGDDDDCDEGKTCSGVGNPAPAGDTTPPDNGLFVDGKAPKVDVN